MNASVMNPCQADTFLVIGSPVLVACASAMGYSQMRRAIGRHHTTQG
ncbi:MAG: hypothetical protein AB7I98_22370 [Verrucomicrobiales bacterium]|nr:hypothetical protein [Verrucomicrobiae bacterium]MCP5553552.1 hypothetical protein [Akkermansiaceae bacterium]